MPCQTRGWCELPPLPSSRYDVTKVETDAARVSPSHLLTEREREREEEEEAATDTHILIEAEGEEKTEREKESETNTERENQRRTLIGSKPRV